MTLAFTNSSSSSAPVRAGIYKISSKTTKRLLGRSEKIMSCLLHKKWTSCQRKIFSCLSLHHYLKKKQGFWSESLKKWNIFSSTFCIYIRCMYVYTYVCESTTKKHFSCLFWIEKFPCEQLPCTCLVLWRQKTSCVWQTWPNLPPTVSWSLVKLLCDRSRGEKATKTLTNLPMPLNC